MNKAELVKSITTATNLAKSDTEQFLDAFLRIVSDAISNEEVKIIGFGTFASAERPERIGRNPQTGAEMKIAARKIPLLNRARL